jgi:hypothetical protein
MLITEPYLAQKQRWPKQGRHILAQYNATTIVVYQAYNPEIGHYAVTHQRLGGAFSYRRMSWIKPNFLWMMYRSGWGTQENQQVTLALRLRRTFFDALLAQAVPSSWERARFPTQEAWTDAVKRSSVRLQWDPDHDPCGRRLPRRALQIGLRGAALAAFGKHELLEVLDISDFVAEQRACLTQHGEAALCTPQERSYRPADPTLEQTLGLAAPS